MIDPDVRRATASDAGELTTLERLARETVAATRGGPRWLDAHPVVGDGWAQATAARAVFLAEIRAAGATPVAVGYLVADLAHDPMPVACIDQVFVREEARELGFGDALVAAAVAWGRTQGAELVEAVTLPGDRDLKNLYERAGITARLIVVSKAL